VLGTAKLSDVASMNKAILPTFDSTRTCIYCRKSADRSLFNKEHVVHKSMTSGIQNNLTLEPEEHQFCVCSECNSAFGDTIDLSFGRDSVWSLLRFKHGSKPLSALKNLRYDRTKYRRPSNANGVPGGELIAVDDGQKDFLMRQPPQLRLFNKVESEFEFFSSAKFPELVRNSEKYDISQAGLHVSPKLSQLELEAFQAKACDILKKMGAKTVTLGSSHITADSLEEPVVQFTMDDITMRPIAKIAFNYLAFVLNDSQPEWILSHELDSVRQYIRSGKPTDNFRVVRQTNEGAQQSKPEHLVALNCVKVEGVQQLIAYVSLFNSVPFEVKLANEVRDFPGSRSKAHVWNFNSFVCERRC
jgi:hypothetical protein